MVMLTQVLRFAVRDEQGRHAPVSDLAIALLDDDYPPVTYIYFEQNGNKQRIPWDLVTDLDTKGQTVRVNDLDAAEASDGEKEVLLKRDILDALILDLLGRRTTRVCDVLLDANDGQLRVKATDAGFAAVVRRIFHVNWPAVDQTSVFDWKYVEFLRGDPDAVRNGAGYRMRISRLPAGEIALLSDYIPYLHAAELLKLLPDEKAADVLEDTSIERQVQIIEELDEAEAINLLCLMTPDRATDLTGRLELPTMHRYLSKMPARSRDRIIDLLRYSADSVGGAMTNDIIELPIDLDRTDAKRAAESVLEKVHFSSLVFIVDNKKHRHLCGAITLRDLLAADGSKSIEDLMDPYLQTLSPYDDAKGAAYRIVGGQLPAMAVVNTTGRLLGAMTMEAALPRLLPPTSGVQRLRIYS
ncbi:MAG TPA: CBS domain-containing protein [Pyrinomonadaceae bacterium]